MITSKTTTLLLAATLLQSGLFACNQNGETADDGSTDAQSDEERYRRHRWYSHDMAVKPPADMTANAPVDMAVKAPVDMAVKAPSDMATKAPSDMATKAPVDMSVPPLPLPPPIPPADMAAASGVDPFGVKKLYPTVASGREWILPATADQPDAEWQPNTTVTKIAAGLFEVSGAPRMMVVSPAGKGWWRNVEMTAYLRETGTVNFYVDQVPHWELFVRGEEHTNDFISPQSINGGVAAPIGTATWPGYPFAGLGSINHACLASCYHGHAYPDGKLLFEKEISHIEGYVFGIAQQNVPNFQSAMSRWFGYKLVVRNERADTQVHMEIWVDENDTGNWIKATEADDTGNLVSANANMNGCGSAPFNYKTNQVVTWAGPWASFRVDNMTYQFKALSVREIAPLP